MKAYEEFCQLVDKRDLDAPLAPAEASRLEELAALSSQAAQELSVRRALTELDVPLSERSDEALVEEALSTLWESEKVVALRQDHQDSMPLPVTQTSSASRARGFALLSAAALGLAFTGWYLQEGPSSESVEKAARLQVGNDVSALSSPQQTHVEFTLTSGEVLVGERRFRVGEEILETDSVVTVNEGYACLSLERSVDLCLTEHSRLKLEGLKENTQRLSLLSGKVIVSQPRNSHHNPLSVLFLGAQATAAGAVFSVERTSLAQATVTTLEGVVEVRAGSELSRVSAGQRLSFGGLSLSKSEPITRADEAGEQALLAPLPLWKPQNITVLNLESEPPGALATIEGIEVGRTPLSLLVRSGAAELRLERPGYEPMVEQATLRFGQELKLSFSLEPKTSERGVPTEKVLPSKEALLAEARAHMAGSRFDAAERSYRQLRQFYPSSPESHTVLLTLGHLRLDRLGDATGGLAAFQAYLGAGGALSQEAHLGKIRALRKLGRKAEEQKAMEHYSAIYKNLQ